MARRAAINDLKQLLKPMLACGLVIVVPFMVLWLMLTVALISAGLGLLGTVIIVVCWGVLGAIKDYKESE